MKVKSWPDGTPRMPTAACPWCGHPNLDAAAPISEKGARPGEGDWSICIHCGGLNRFTAGLGLRRATATEVATAPPEERDMLLKAQRMIRMMEG